jgi:magnesium transporter
MSESRFYHILKSGEFRRVDSLSEVLHEGEKEGFIWLDYCQPTKEELMSLVEPLGLHPLAIEDSTDQNQIPKIEDYPHHSFILINGFDYLDGVLSVYELDLFIGKNFLVSVNGCKSNGRPFFQDMDRYISQQNGNSQKGPAFLAHILLDYVVDKKFVAIEALEDDLDRAEDLILSEHEKFNPGDLMDLRRDLLTVRKSLFHEREVLMKISRNDCQYIPDQALIYYRDIYDHLAKFFELTESYRDIVTSLMEMYLSMINNKMTNAANETNVIVRRLTVINTIFMPLTLLAGIGGMSEWSMMTGPQNWRIAYPLFLVGMGVIAAINYYLLKMLEKRGNKKG